MAQEAKATCFLDGGGSKETQEHAQAKHLLLLTIASALERQSRRLCVRRTCHGCHAVHEVPLLPRLMQLRAAHIAVEARGAVASADQLVPDVAVYDDKGDAVLLVEVKKTNAVHAAKAAAMEGGARWFELAAATVLEDPWTWTPLQEGPAQAQAVRCTCNGLTSVQLLRITEDGTVSCPWHATPVLVAASSGCGRCPYRHPLGAVPGQRRVAPPQRAGCTVSADVVDKAADGRRAALLRKQAAEAERRRREQLAVEQEAAAAEAKGRADSRARLISNAAFVIRKARQELAQLGANDPIIAISSHAFRVLVLFIRRVQLEAMLTPLRRREQLAMEQEAAAEEAKRRADSRARLISNADFVIRAAQQEIAQRSADDPLIAFSSHVLRVLVLSSRRVQSEALRRTQRVREIDAEQEALRVRYGGHWQLRNEVPLLRIVEGAPSGLHVMWGDDREVLGCPTATQYARNIESHGGCLRCPHTLYLVTEHRRGGEPVGVFCGHASGAHGTVETQRPDRRIAFLQESALTINDIDNASAAREAYDKLCRERIDLGEVV